MPIVTAVLACVAFLCFGIAIGIGYRRFRVSRQGAAALASLEQLAAALAGLAQDLAHQRTETEHARAARDAEARRANEYFQKIEGCVLEATESRRLLVRTGAEHGAAQGMMLQEIESLAHQYRQLSEHYRAATGKPPARPEPRLNSAIQTVADEFRESHVAPYQNPAPSHPVA